MAGFYGDMDLTGASGHTLNVHTPPWDADPLQALYGTDALYNMEQGHRNSPLTEDDLDLNAKRQDAEKSYDGEGPYDQTRSRPTPTTIHKNCGVGVHECGNNGQRGAFMGFWNTPRTEPPV